MTDKDKIQKKILNSIGNNPHGLLKLAPRVGKTKLAIDIIKNSNSNKILWVTPSQQLRDVDIPKEFKTWKALSFLKKTTIVTYSYLSKVEGCFDKVILDEYQDVTVNNTKGFFNGNIKYNSIIGLSGTDPEHEEKKEIYKALNLKTLYEITIDEAVKYNLISDYAINVVECNLSSVNNLEVKTKNHQFKTSEVKKYQYLDRVTKQMMYSNKDAKFMILNRMRFIHNSPTKLEVAKKLISKLKGRKLIFASNVNSSEELSDYTYNYKTSDKNLNLFLNGDIDELCCVNSGGVGFTFKNVDHFIITQANSNKKGDITQKIARSLLHQKSYKASIYLICLLNTQDEKWVDKALSEFDDRKINYINYKNL